MIYNLFGYPGAGKSTIGNEMMTTVKDIIIIDLDGLGLSGYDYGEMKLIVSNYVNLRDFFHVLLIGNDVSPRMALELEIVPILLNIPRSQAVDQFKERATRDGLTVDPDDLDWGDFHSDDAIIFTPSQDKAHDAAILATAIRGNDFSGPAFNQEWIDLQPSPETDSSLALDDAVQQTGLPDVP
jgi:hypothetical protein